MPGSAVRVSPTTALPLIVGSLLFFGDELLAIRGVGFEFAVVEPSLFLAVTSEITV